MKGESGTPDKESGFRTDRGSFTTGWESLDTDKFGKTSWFLKMNWGGWSRWDTESVNGVKYWGNHIQV